MSTGKQAVPSFGVKTTVEGVTLTHSNYSTFHSIVSLPIILDKMKHIASKMNGINARLEKLESHLGH